MYMFWHYSCIDLLLLAMIVSRNVSIEAFLKPLAPVLLASSSAPQIIFALSTVQPSYRKIFATLLYFTSLDLVCSVLCLASQPALLQLLADVTRLLPARILVVPSGA
ncbi:hypothetical protein BKA64DRAFT_455651 [Cadophora sp. MPI-SDFR-AT-0126]|nr:hypothetical protein BKA64DRAFT_455651 [Leotiomycetes sp. MPI-SDFR-AT-0126]